MSHRERIDKLVDYLNKKNKELKRESFEKDKKIRQLEIAVFCKNGDHDYKKMLPDNFVKKYETYECCHSSSYSTYEETDLGSDIRMNNYLIIKFCERCGRIEALKDNAKKDNWKILKTTSLKHLDANLQKTLDKIIDEDNEEDED